MAITRDALRAQSHGRAVGPSHTSSRQSTRKTGASDRRQEFEWLSPASRVAAEGGKCGARVGSALVDERVAEATATQTRSSPDTWVGTEHDGSVQVA